MTDPTLSGETLRAEVARAQLLRDIREIKKMGNKMIEKTETVVHKAPALLGLGAAGVAVLGFAIFAARRPSRRVLRVAHERSFLAEALRGAALSALGILAGRLTQHLLASAAPEASEPARPVA